MTKYGNFTILHVPTQQFMYTLKCDRKFLTLQWENILKDDRAAIDRDESRCGLYLAHSLEEAARVISEDCYIEKLRKSSVVMLTGPKKMFTELMATPYFKLMMYPDLTNTKFKFYLENIDKLFKPYIHDFEIIKVPRRS